MQGFVYSVSNQIKIPSHQLIFSLLELNIWTMDKPTDDQASELTFLEDLQCF